MNGNDTTLGQYRLESSRMRLVLLNLSIVRDIIVVKSWIGWSWVKETQRLR